MTRSEDTEQKQRAKQLLSKAKEAEIKQKMIAVKVNNRTTILITEKKMKDVNMADIIVESMQRKYNFGKKKNK